MSRPFTSRSVSSASASAKASPGHQRAAPSWEDEAWASDSDDDDFVSRQRVRRARAAEAADGTEARTPRASRMPAGDVRSGPSAPPARPHPYPVPGARSASSSSSASQPLGASPGSTHPPGANPGSWTLVDRANGHRDAATASRTSLAGSPPTDVGASAAAAMLAAAVSDSEEAAPRTARAAARKASISGAHGRGRRMNELEREELRGRLRTDVDRVVDDPTRLLSHLSLSWAHEPPSPHSASASASPAPSPIEPRARPAAARRRDVDVVSMGGDGLISSGGFGASDAELATSAAADDVSPSDAAPSLGIGRKNSTRTVRRREQFVRCLSKDSCPLDELRTLAWQGVPTELRPIVWQLLLGYLPPSRPHRASVLARKRAEFAAGARLAFARGDAGLDAATFHQVRIDVVRTHPGILLWQREATQRALERILYVWAIRHPASGYVQGINDLATPFFEVFLSAYISGDPESYDVSLLPPEALEALEADTFWCLSKLLDGIQDNYIFAQPGIQRQVRRMEKLVARIDPPLHAHLQEQGVEYMQFAFRWMNCLLMREMSVQNIVRMWDTYLAEGPDAFSDFHLYVCSVFLSKWSPELLTMDFQGIIMFLQSLPTQSWSDRDAEVLLSDAFVKKSLFGGTAHLTS